VPLPLPLAPAVTVIHETLLVAVHAQPVPAVTVTLPVPPADVRFCDVGDTLNVHGAPAWVTVTVVPATVNVPVRLAVDVFAAAV
jgi:hypothetical protein